MWTNPQKMVVNSLNLYIYNILYAVSALLTKLLLNGIIYSYNHALKLALYIVHASI